MIHDVKSALEMVRLYKPLVLCLTNNVSIDLVANSLLAIGASPIMSNCDDELEDLIHLSKCLVINIGTLNSAFIKRAKVALEIAKRNQIPVILDPVGAGASLVRTKHARDFLKFVDIVKGNASEIMALCDEGIKTLGVDSIASPKDARKHAEDIALKYKSTVVVTGDEDFVTNGDVKDTLYIGSPLMSQVTGMGCALTGVVGAFRAAISDSYQAARLATYYFGACGLLTQHKTKSPGSFRAHFIDALYDADFETMQEIID